MVVGIRLPRLYAPHFLQKPDFFNKNFFRKLPTRNFQQKFPQVPRVFVSGEPARHLQTVVWFASGMLSWSSSRFFCCFTRKKRWKKWDMFSQKMVVIYGGWETTFILGWLIFRCYIWMLVLGRISPRSWPYPHQNYHHQKIRLQ